MNGAHLPCHHRSIDFVPSGKIIQRSDLQEDLGMGSKLRLISVALAALLYAVAFPWGLAMQAQDIQPQVANSNKDYLQLRNISTSDEVIEVNNLVLKRDAGVFTFKSGYFFFLAPVEGKITGAVFLGEGTFSLRPPLEAERRNLLLLGAQRTLFYCRFACCPFRSARTLRC
jgi:hypothetical protein